MINTKTPRILRITDKTHEISRNSVTSVAKPTDERTMLPSVINHRSSVLTDHTYIDTKLNDIGWATKIVLPSLCDSKY